MLLWAWLILPSLISTVNYYTLLSYKQVSANAIKLGGDVIELCKLHYCKVTIVLHKIEMLKYSIRNIKDEVRGNIVFLCRSQTWTNAGHISTDNNVKNQSYL